jgi:hypothetical protein
MASGLARPGTDGEIVRSPVPGVYLRCEVCGDLLRYLVRFGGRALCKSCVATAATARRRP